jgi:hypothetical protein
VKGLVLAIGVGVATGLVSAASVLACVCADAPLSERLDDADAAIVGKIVADRETNVQGARQTLYTVEVAQRVKGDVGDTIIFRSPLGTDCDLRDAAAPAMGEDGTTGLLLTRAPDGSWLGSACSVVSPGRLVAEGGEPRGGVIKVGVGIMILGLVLLWALRRLKRGARPDLPGAPGS